MPKMKLFSQQGGDSEIDVGTWFSEGEVSQDLIFRSVQAYLVNQRQGTRATKMRGAIAGTTRKPWPQKHTGRARHGSRTSPIWTGGGVAFGPQPTIFEQKLPKKMKRLALASAIRDRVQEDRVVLIDKIQFEAPKTRDAVALLEKLDLADGKVLILVSQDELGIALRKSFSNLQRVECMAARQVNPYEIVLHDRLLITAGALEELNARVN